MPTVTYTVTTVQINELKDALAHHQGVDVADISNDDVKTWGLRQFQVIAQNYRRSVVDAANPVSSDPIAT